MTSSLATVSGRSREYMVIGGAGAAIALLYVMTMATWPTDGTNPENPPLWATGPGWSAGTLAVAALVATLGIVAVRDVRATWHAYMPGPARGHGLRVGLGTAAWFAGGLYSLLRFVHAQADVCRGSGAWSFGCQNRSGLLLTVLGLGFTASATLVLVALTIPDHRSPVSKWLSPVLILGLYLLALRMWMPHVGLGVPSRDLPMP
ncbi:hypothetical protein [Actinomadura sp. B10D3]|uniref:hypothetical protein n=1 Tax=Actinomadura sp. B10D3 TaxID=3153557 RepID=UPI00325D8536